MATCEFCMEREANHLIEKEETKVLPVDPSGKEKGKIRSKVIKYIPICTACSCVRSIFGL